MPQGQCTLETLVQSNPVLKKTCQVKVVENLVAHPTLQRQLDTVMELNQVATCDLKLKVLQLLAAKRRLLYFSRDVLTERMLHSSKGSDL